ncbi:hypothetical protein [Agrilutibacter solisilvae]|uniref:Uncharacterized protein n=1 Tax=Agrilutibacter solisilvae TaxID=2763317 RepID=A0A975ASJ6_9GAMM|nr:hypothetical protein [Lysobacter solisilvae]QSX78129.1 hypothetical protein I8J32_015740 [Lysobacter solisilvae]
MQNLVSLTVSEAQVAQALAGLAQIEAALPGLISLDPADRRSLSHMGPKSEVFVRLALRGLEQNPQIVPASLDLAAAKQDMDAHDKLRPVFEQMRRLMTRLDDTVGALGSDAMEAALEGYNHIKIASAAHGLEGLRKELAARWSKSRRVEEDPQS